MGIDDRVDTTANKDAFITLKDHKPSSATKPTCRLINPTKSEIGRISKVTRDRINSKITRASDFASAYDNITNDERNIIIHAKNSILIHKQQALQKKGDTTFDVTMGSYDGAETCELVGSFLLSQLQNLYVNIGLYRDDSLAVSNAAQRDTENIKKEICRVFNQHGLRITIEAYKQIINFLDVTFNLNNSTYQPFAKRNTRLSFKQGTTDRGMGMGNWEWGMGNF